MISEVTVVVIAHDMLMQQLQQHDVQAQCRTHEDGVRQLRWPLATMPRWPIREATRMTVKGGRARRRSVTASHAIDSAAPSS